MTRALAFLVVASARNRVLVRLRRLKEPRYLVGTAVGVLYFYVAFFRGRGSGGFGFGGAAPEAVLQQFGDLVITAGSLALWVVVLMRWALASRPSLRFSAAEAQFLFAAPVTRRQLVHYKLLRSQIGVLFSTLIALLFARRAVGIDPLAFVFGLWLLLATLGLHLEGVGLNWASLRQPGGRRQVQVWLPLAITALGSAVVAAALLGAAASGADSGAGLVERVVRAAGQGTPAFLLWPFRALVRPILASSPGGFALAAWPALLLLVLNYSWVLSSDLRLEESVAATDRARTAGRLPVPRGVVARRAPFPLRANGRPEVAIFWKNLVALSRYLSLRNLLRVALPLVVLAAAVGVGRRSTILTESLSVVCLVVAGGAALLGPQLAQNDLRFDLPMLPVLKTWPLTGEALLLGELLAPAAVVIGASWLALVAGVGFSLGLPAASLSPIDRAIAALAAMIAVPGVVVLQLVIHNGVVVLFPAWVSVGPNRPRGIEAMGQQMLLFGGVFLVLALGLAPAAAVAAVLTAGLWTLTGLPALIPGAALLTAILGAETWLAIVGLGRVLERTDPSAVIAAE